MAGAEQRVRGFRNHHDIAVYRDDEWAERGEITLDAAAETLGVAKMTALRIIRRGDLKGRQACKGAPWVIKAEDVPAFDTPSSSTDPVTPNPVQQILQFRDIVDAHSRLVTARPYRDRELWFANSAST